MALALLVAGVAASTWLDPARLLSRLPIQSAGTVISGTKIIMAQPKLSGYTKDSRWYELVAIAAAQDITKPDLVELQQVNARLEMQDKSTMNLSALDGVFDRKAAILTLGRDILLRSTAGFEIRLEHAVVDTANGHIVSDKPVEVRMQQGTLNANRLEVSNSGEVIRFEGGVTMNLQPAAGDRAAAVRTP